MLRSKSACRLFAAVWFAVAAAIPVGLSFLFTPLSSGKTFQIVTTCVSILGAGVFGSWLGATILDEKKTRSALWAAMRGLAVAALSYFFLFAVELFVAVLYNDNIDSDGFFRLISVIALTFLIALLVFGWLIAVTGAAAGALLYLFQNKTTESGTNRNSLSDK